MASESRVTTVRHFASMIREIGLILLVLIVIVFPGSVAWWMKSMNSKVSGTGGTTTTKLALGPLEVAFENTSQQVSELDNAKKAIDVLQQQVEQLANNAKTSQERQGAQKALESATTVASKLDASISSAKTTLLAQDQVIQDAPGKATGPGRYGIVVSADKQDDLAGYEVSQLKKRGYPDVALYDRQGFLRTVTRFPDSSAAEAAVPNIQSYRKTAYLINLDKWCPDPQDSGKKVSGMTVFTCR